jgi:hypothetical protein
MIRRVLWWLAVILLAGTSFRESVRLHLENEDSVHLFDGSGAGQVAHRVGLFVIARPEAPGRPRGTLRACPLNG